MTSSSTNIFGIHDPTGVACSVLGYRLGLAELRLGVFSPEDNGDAAKLMELVFSSPFYFEGPFGWRGADFQLASATEMLQLCRQIGWFDSNITDGEAEKYVASFNLYEVTAEDSRFRIRILATDAYKYGGA